MRIRALVVIGCGSVSAMILSPGTLHAQYLDPGAGSILLQAGIAVAVGAIAGVKIYWGKISAFWSQRSKGVGDR